jgi:hypothetical protein
MTYDIVNLYPGLGRLADVEEETCLICMVLKVFFSRKCPDPIS